MPTATAIRDTVEVLSSYVLEGHHWIEVPCPDDYETFKGLPAALAYEGRQYGRTGFNSDRKVAYYSTQRGFARGI